MPLGLAHVQQEGQQEGQPQGQPLAQQPAVWEAEAQPAPPAGVPGGADALMKLIIAMATGGDPQAAAAYSPLMARARKTKGRARAG